MGTNRLPNLSEILSPTVQQDPGDNEEPGQDVDGGDDGHNCGAGAVGHRTNGSYHCNVVQDEGKM